MKLVFKKIEIHNFMSFGDQILEFDDYNGMTRIKGHNLDIPNQLNGSGKSTLSNALVYGLFGEMPFKLKNENICNRYLDDKNTKVVVHFEASRKKYKITTGLKGKQSYCELVTIDKNGTEKNLTKSSIAETRSYLEREILHCDMNLFMRTIFLNSDPNFNFYNLKQADKKEFIDKLFDISIFGDIYNFIHKENNRIEKEIIAHQNKLIVLNKSSEDYKTKTEEFENNSKTEIERLENEIAELKNKLDNEKNNAIELNSELIDKCKKTIEAIEKKLNSLNSKNGKLSIELTKRENEIKRLNSNIKDRCKIIEKHSELHGKLCNDCKTIYSKYHNLDSYRKEIDDSENKIAAIKTDCDKLKNELESNSSSIKELSEKLEIVSEKSRNKTNEYENKQKDIRNLEFKINSLENKLENVKNSKNPYIGLISENENLINSENSLLNEIMEQYRYSKFSETIVDQENLKRYIIKDMIGVLNNKIKHYVHKLGANYDIVFDEEMKYDFITTAKSGVEFNNFSKGEQSRISIATCFAFRDFLSARSNISSNIFILDEFFDSNVDSLALENTLDILNEFSTVNKQKIFIVSHRSEISDEIFDNIINIEKKNNISYVVKKQV